MPAPVIHAWQTQRDEWLRQNGADPSRPDWESQLQDWPIPRQRAFRRFVSDRWLEHLDGLHGACVLRQPECARIVADSLRHFDVAPRTPHTPCEVDGPAAACSEAPIHEEHNRHEPPHTECDQYEQAHTECDQYEPHTGCDQYEPHTECEEYVGRYYLSDFVVMPNHVHILVGFPDEEAMLKQCESWKRFTARQINRTLNRRGRLWQQDAFDHLVRSPEQFQRLRTYIADNPSAARLGAHEYIHYRRS